MDNNFQGKKAMCFIALSHHIRMIFPIMQALKQRGMEIVYFVAPAESAFEITLLDEGLPYLHALDYADGEVQAQIRRAYKELRSPWQEKILAHPALQVVPFPIQDKNNWSVLESLFSFRRMFEVEKPDVLFALHERNMWGKIIGYLSHELSIPYITFQEGYYFGSPPCYRFHTDYSTACVVWGEFKRNLLIRGGSCPDKTVPLGNIDLWKSRAETLKPETVAATRKELGIGPQKKLVLFLMCNANYATLATERLTRWLEARGDVVHTGRNRKRSDATNATRGIECCAIPFRLPRRLGSNRGDVQAEKCNLCRRWHSGRRRNQAGCSGNEDRFPCCRRPEMADVATRDRIPLPHRRAAVENTSEEPWLAQRCGSMGLSQLRSTSGCNCAKIRRRLAYHV